MKKLFTTAFALAMMSAASFGQRVADVSIQSIDGPTEIQSTTSGTDFNLNCAVYNDGPDDLMIGDTIFYLMQIVKDGSVLIQTPNANQLVVQRGPVLTRNVIPGDTFHFVLTLSSSSVINVSLEVDVTMLVLVSNRPDLPFEGQATLTNNLAKKTGVIWWNAEKWPVSVKEVNKGIVNIYPNPAADKAVLNVEIADLSAPTQVAVYDMKGNLVQSFAKLAGDVSGVEINTSSMINGIYVVKVSNGEQQHTTKMVVNH